MTRVTLKKRRYRLPRLAALAAFIGFIALVAAAACSSIPTGVAALAGRYELRSVDGRSLPDERLGGAISGELVLRADGRATRVVHHMRSGLPDPFVHRSTGTYRVRGSQITLLLTDAESSLPTTARYSVNGEIEAQSIVIRYPGPADEPIEERYVRVAP